MSDKPRNLTRNQLAEFLPNARAVKAFEQLLKQVNSLLPTDVETILTLISESTTDASIANSKANEALAAIELVKSILDLAPTCQHQPQDDQLTPPAVSVQPGDDLTPPMAFGTMSSQNSDRVSITGGTVQASLVNNQTTLSNSVTLSDNSGANVGTLTNSPVNGNPSKWIGVNDNGTIRYIPTW